MTYTVPLNPNRMMSTFRMQPGSLKMTSLIRHKKASVMSQFAVGGFFIHTFNVPSIFLVGNFRFIVGGASILTMGNLQGVRFCRWGLMPSKFIVGDLQWVGLNVPSTLLVGNL